MRSAVTWVRELFRSLIFTTADQRREDIISIAVYAAILGAIYYWIVL